MVFRGKIENGMVVVEGPRALPEGSSVTIRVLKPTRRRGAKPSGRRKTLYESLRRVVGTVHGLPPDLATNLEHYLYGAPKQK
jgi:hypothetical protein